MKKTIKLKSRYGDTYLLNRVGEKDSHLFSIGDWGICRIGGEENNIEFIDPSGGPFIAVDSFLEEANAKVKSITRNKKGILIEFER